MKAAPNVLVIQYARLHILYLQLFPSILSKLMPNLYMTTSFPREYLIFGSGYVGSFLSKKLTSDRICVSGTHKPTKGFSSDGFPCTSYAFDQHTEEDTDLANVVNSATHILCTIPPNPLTGCDIALSTFRQHILSSHYAGRLEWVGHLSSTSVYGSNCAGWVDEDYPTQPTSAKGIARVTAEDEWLKLYHQHNVPVHIFRLAGIYGPGRNVVDNLLVSSTNLAKREIAIARGRNQAEYTSRIHVEDVVNVLLASAQCASPGEVYNVADVLPATPHEVRHCSPAALRSSQKFQLSCSNYRTRCCPMRVSCCSSQYLRFLKA